MLQSPDCGGGGIATVCETEMHETVRFDGVKMPRLQGRDGDGGRQWPALMDEAFGPARWQVPTG